VLGRLVGQQLSERLGKPFVIENRPAPAHSPPRCRSPGALPTATPS
jgi:hypothetical protein